MAEDNAAAVSDVTARFLGGAPELGEAYGIEQVLVYAIPMARKFRGILRRDGLLLRGPAGWAEAAPFWNYNAAQSLPWLAGALDIASHGLAPLPPENANLPVNVNVTVPIVGPETAAEIVSRSGCRTAKVKVAEPGVGLDADLARVRAVREALGPDGLIRVDANAAWSVAEAAANLEALNAAASGLQYAEQPCASVPELAELRGRTAVPIAADESIRLASDPLNVVRENAADYLVLKAMPLGGPRRAAAVAREARALARGDVKFVVSSALDTSIGLAAGANLAQALGTPLACGLGTLALFEGDVLAPECRLTPRQGLLPPPCPAPHLDPAASPDVPADLADAWQQRFTEICALLPNVPPRAGTGRLDWR